MTIAVDMGRKATKTNKQIGLPAKMAFRWRVDDGPFIVVFGISIPSSTKKKKRYQVWTPSDKTFWICAWHILYNICMKIWNLSNKCQIGAAINFWPIS